MDPDTVLQELRELYNEVQDEVHSKTTAEMYADLFDRLDNWIIGGGFLPKEWQR